MESDTEAEYPQNEMPINRYFRDTKVLQIVEGTNQIQRNIIARNLLGAAENSRQSPRLRGGDGKVDECTRMRRTGWRRWGSGSALRICRSAGSSRRSGAPSPRPDRKSTR